MKKSRNLQLGLFSNETQTRLCRNTREEHGGAAVLALLAIVAIFIISSYQDDTLLGVELSRQLYLSIVLILGTVAAFSSCCALHMRLLGNKPTRAFASEIVDRIDETQIIISKARQKITVYEEEMLSSVSTVSRKASDCVSMLKKIIFSLEGRLCDVADLVNRGDKVSLMEAYDLIRQNLVISENSLDALIDCDPIPPIESYQWKSTIDRLMSEIEHEIYNIAA